MQCIEILTPPTERYPVPPLTSSLRTREYLPVQAGMQDYSAHASATTDFSNFGNPERSGCITLLFVDAIPPSA